MSRLRYLTAGESHGPGLTAVLDGCPAGLAVDVGAVDAELAPAPERVRPRRAAEHRAGPGARPRRRAARPHDRARPLALFIPNRDAANWGDVLAVEAPAEGRDAPEPVVVPRPGHADLGGALLYGLDDIRDVIERASARETAAKVACGAVAKRLLAALGCTVASHVVAIGAVEAERGMSLDDVERVEASPVRCRDAEAGRRMMRRHRRRRGGRRHARRASSRSSPSGIPPGVGSYVQGDQRLRSRLAGAVLSVPAIVGVEFGLGFAAAALPGSRVHDPIAHDAGARVRACEQRLRRYRGRHLHRRDDRRCAPR